MNLWTVGCADPRLTAPARSPMDKPGKTPCVSPTLPTGRRLPTKLHSTPQQDRMNLISGKGETSSGLPAFSLFLPGSCPNYRDRRRHPRTMRRPGSFSPASFCALALGLPVTICASTACGGCVMVASAFRANESSLRNAFFGGVWRVDSLSNVKSRSSHPSWTSSAPGTKFHQSLSGSPDR